jgi:hypothetical protein
LTESIGDADGKGEPLFRKAYLPVGAQKKTKKTARKGSSAPSFLVLLRIGQKGADRQKLPKKRAACATCTNGGKTGFSTTPTVENVENSAKTAQNKEKSPYFGGEFSTFSTARPVENFFRYE